MFQSIFDDKERLRTDCDAASANLVAEQIVRDYLNRFNQFNPRELAYILSNAAMLGAARSILDKRKEVESSVANKDQQR